MNVIAFAILAKGVLTRLSWYLIAYLKRLRYRVRSFVEAAAVPLGISVCLLLWMPPYWAGSDSTTLLLFRLDYIPHFPPLYPQIIEIFHFLFGTSHAEVVAVLWFQQLLLVLSIAYFASAQPLLWQRLVVASLMSAGSLLGMAVHGVSTESVALPMLVFVAGAFVRIAAHGPSFGAPLFVYCAGLLFAALGRHPFIVFGAFLPAFYLLQAIFSRRERSRSVAWFATSSLLVVGVYAVSQGVQSGYCAVLGRDCTSIVWRAGVYRMHEAGSMLTAEERSRWIADLQAATTDPRVATAVEIMVRNASPWYGTFQEMEQHLELGQGSIDNIANQAFAIFFRTPSRVWFQQYARNFRGYFLRDSLPHQNLRYGVDLLGRQDTAKTATLPEISRDILMRTGYLQDNDEQGVGRHIFTSAVTFVDSISPLRVMLLCMALAIGGLVGSRGKSPEAMAAIAILLCILLYAMAMALATVVIARYQAPVHLMAWLGLATVLSSVSRVLLGRGVPQVQGVGKARIS